LYLIESKDIADYFASPLYQTR